MRMLNVAFVTLTLALSVCGCISLPSDRFAIIDKSFLDEIISRPNKERLRELWDTNADELMYLDSKGDKKAIEASICLMCAVKDLGCSFQEDVDELALVTWQNADWEHFWNVLSKRACDDQFVVLDLYDYIWNEGPKIGGPLDWADERDRYLSKHREVAEAYKKMRE